VETEEDSWGNTLDVVNVEDLRLLFDVSMDKDETVQYCTR
jgi:hypothetical protein